ncbi:unnamed protein product [Prorocentrum cordatum]|uniref:Uncharacterized protein n=1 Tax=Prorocentrum cordatum TaxID=2364126 RepID=A0ABN9TWZ0_9DINO|nr:unnamed protein product [Polarella glacialis]
MGFGFHAGPHFVHPEVQGNCVSVIFPGACLDWPTELQPLGRKTGAALAKCMVDVVSGVLGLLKEQTVLSWSFLRFVHLLAGDGIHANQNAARRLLRFCQEHARWGAFRVRYRLVVAQCASRAAILAVILAICGDLAQNAVENNDICANCSRLYKHLIPDCSEECPMSLKLHLDEKFRMRVEARALQTHYGESALPEALLDISNASWTQRVTVAQAAREEAASRRKAFRVLHARVLVVEDKPVPTRFLPFAARVARLLSMSMMDLPIDAFTLSLAAPRKQGHKRLRRFRDWCKSESAGESLRIAPLRLQLTLHAVQAKTLLHMGVLLDRLHLGPDLTVLVAVGSLLVTEALDFLLSAPAREELDGTLANSAGASLDVERARQQVKRPEKGKVVSVATASRNNVPRKYLPRRSGVAKSHMKQEKKTNKLKFVSWRALGVSEGDARSLLHPGSDEEARRFVAENKCRFKQVAAAIRPTALAIDGNHLSEIFPALNRGWLSWLGNSPRFADLPNAAGPKRSSVNHRVHVGDAAHPPAPSWASLSWGGGPAGPDWLRKLGQCHCGWLSLSCGERRLGELFFCATLRGVSAVATLRAPPWDEDLNRFELDCSDPAQISQPILEPLGPAVARATGPIVVDRLGAVFVEALPHRAFAFPVAGSAKVHLRRRAAKTGARCDADGGEEPECESEADDASDADAMPVVFEREAEAEHEGEEVQNMLAEREDEARGDGAQGEPAATDRAPAGTRVDALGSDGYLTHISNPGWPDQVVQGFPTWNGRG